MQQQRRRSRLIIGLVSLGLLAGAALTAPPAQAVEAVGPYYALPAWDQSLPAATRFVVLTNWGSAAVLDKETGLVWERSPSSATFTWGQARLACTGRTTGTRRGWRLPSIPELTSLVDPANSNPALPTGHPFTTVQSDGYWSATTDVGNPTIAWRVFFSGGDAGDLPKGNVYHAWCVRGGMQAEAY